MSWMYHEHRRAHVTWWPSDGRLHYAALCCGIYEYLRQPPCIARLGEAIQYLADLNRYPLAPMQQDRIRWTSEWIRATKAMFAG